MSFGGYENTWLSEKDAYEIVAGTLFKKSIISAEESINLSQCFAHINQSQTRKHSNSPLELLSYS